nr:uncharacterized protein LOC108069883 [Drosophila takahashii]
MSHKKTKIDEEVNQDGIREVLSDSDPWMIPFPLPEHKDPSMCRDEFLSSFIRKHEARAESLRPRSTVRVASIPGVLEATDPGNPKGAEAMVVLQLAKQRQAGTTRKTVEEVMASIRMRSTLLAELNYQCQKAAIEFLSVRLLKQLRLFSNPWPGEREGVPHNLFSWSLNDFLMRLQMKQIYLDVLHRERSSEDLDCAKFCRDLSEIELLIYEIRQNYRDDKDLCQNSIQLLRNAQYTIHAPWVKTLKWNLQGMEDHTRGVSTFQRSSAFKMDFRHRSVMGDFENASALDPIEMRYQINWIRSSTDQRLLRLNGKEESMRDELREMEEQALQDESVQHSCELMYSLELGKLRESIKMWQDRLDTDLENADVLCTVTKLAVQKVNDDLKFYMEQKEMYLTRLDEVQALIAQEEVYKEI